VTDPSAETRETPALGRKVGTGAAWSALNAGMLRLATFTVSLVVAHLVAPYEFGVFTVALTVFTIVASLSELGVISAIVREPERTDKIAPTVFTISLATSTTLALLMVVAAGPLAQVMGAGEAAGAVRVLSLVVLLGGFSQVPSALLVRDYLLGRQFVADAGFFVASTAVLLVLVSFGYSVMALAISRVAGQLVTVVLMSVLAPEKYRPGFDWHEAKHLFAFGLPLAGSNVVLLAIANVDFIVIGHLLHARQLGYYMLAFNIASWPVTVFSAVLINVTLPTLSRVRTMPAELSRHLRAGMSAVVAASFPLCALLVALAGPLIDVVYGRRWHAAWAALAVLAIFGAARTVLQLFSDLTIALGHTRRLLAVQLSWLILLVPAMWFGVHRWGIAGAGIAHAAVVVLAVIPMYLVSVGRGTSVPLGWLRGSLSIPLTAAVGAGASAHIVGLLPGSDILRLLGGLAAGLAVYAVVAGRWLRRLLRTLRSMYWNDRRDASTEDDAVDPDAERPTRVLALPEVGRDSDASEFDAERPTRVLALPGVAHDSAMG
jgi:PST family polysaccharide transporter